MACGWVRCLEVQTTTSHACDPTVLVGPHKACVLGAEEVPPSPVVGMWPGAQRRESRAWHEGRKIKEKRNPYSKGKRGGGQR